MSTAQSGTVFFATINISTATTTTSVAAVTGSAIVVIGLTFCLSGTTPTAKIQDGAATALTGVWDVAGIYSAVGSREVPLFSTASGQSLQIVTTGTVSVRGHIAYILSTAG